MYVCLSRHIDQTLGPKGMKFQGFRVNAWKNVGATIPTPGGKKEKKIFHVKKKFIIIFLKLLIRAFQGNNNNFFFFFFFFFFKSTKSLMVKAQVSSKQEILYSNPGLSFSFQFYLPLPSLTFILQSFPSSFIHFFLPPVFPPLFMLTLFVVTMQTNYTKTNNSSEFQAVGNLLFIITPFLQNSLTFHKNQREYCMPTYDMLLLE